MKRNMTKILSIVAVLAMLITLCVVLGTTAAAEGQTHAIENATQLASLFAGEEVNGKTLASGDIVEIQNDFYMSTGTTLASSITVNVDVTITSAAGGPYTIFRGSDDATAITVGAETPMFDVVGTATLTLTDIILDGQKELVKGTVTTKSAAIRVKKTNNDSYATLIVESGTVIQNFTATIAPAIYADGAVTIAGGKISGNTATSTATGGAVYVGSVGIGVTMTGGEISGNEAAYGGGVFVDGSTSFSMSGGKISGNTATQQGAAIMVKTASTVTISGNAEIINNTATHHGGAIAVQYAGTKAKINIQGGEISGNKATNGSGGAVYVPTETYQDDKTTIKNNSTAVVITMSGGAVSNNTAKKDGGAFYLGSKETTLTISGGTVSGNSGVLGGAVEVLAGATLTVRGENTKITDNTSTSRGGAVEVQGTFNLEGGEISGNHVKTSATSNAGGAVFTRQASTFKMTGGSIINNTVEYTVSNDSRATAGLYANGWASQSGRTDIEGGIIGGNLLNGSPDDISVSNTNVIDEEALTVYGVWNVTTSEQLKTAVAKDTASNNNYVHYDEFKIYIQNDITVTDALTTGGQTGTFKYLVTSAANDENKIYTLTRDASLAGSEFFTIGSRAQYTFENITIDGGGSAVTGTKEGSALLINYYSPSVTLGSGATIQNFVSSNAGVIYLNTQAESTGTLTILDGAKVTGNSAASGVIRVTYGTLDIQGGEISKNKTTGSTFGGIILFGNCNTNDTQVLTITGGKFIQNEAKKNAGVIEIGDDGVVATIGDAEGETPLVLGCTVNGCKHDAAARTAGTCEGNVTEGGGGFLYVSAAADVTLTNVTVRGNKAQIGGGLDIRKGTVTLGSTVIVEGNTATLRGGAVNTAAELIISGATIRNNTCTSGATVLSSYAGGGGMYIQQAGVVTINSGSIQNNKADKTLGGGIFNSGKLTFNGGTIEGNSALCGGGVYNYTSKNVCVFGGGTGTLTAKISGNTATEAGGGIYASQAFTIQTGALIEENKATGALGGGIYMTTNDVDKPLTAIMNGGTIKGNQAKDGAGVYLMGYASSTEGVANKVFNFVINGGEINGNQCTNRGGALFINKYSEVYMMGGSLNENTNTSMYGGALQINGDNAKFYMFGGEVKGNYIVAEDNGVKHGMAMNASKGTIYLIGGIISGNHNPNFASETAWHNTTFSFYGTTGEIRIGTPAETVTLPTGANAASGEALLITGNNGQTFSHAGSATAAQAVLEPTIAAGSKLDLWDSGEDVFMKLNGDKTATSLSALCLASADAGFRPTVATEGETNTLTWGTAAYQFLGDEAGLRDQIRYSVLLAMRNKANADVTVEFNGADVSGTPDENGRGTWYHVYMSPEKMKDKVFIKVGGEEAETTTLFEYLDATAKDEKETKETRDLAQAIIYYGYAAQEAFANGDSTYVGDLKEAVSNAGLTFPTTGNTPTNTASGAKFHKARVLIDTQIIVEITVQDLGTDTLTMGGTPLTSTSTNGNLTVFKLTPLYAYEISERKEFSLTNGNTLNYGVYDFLANVYGTSQSTNDNLLTAIFYYAEMVREYISPAIQ